MCLTRERRYPAHPETVARARDFTSAFLFAVLRPRAWQLADDAALIVSEMVSAAEEAGAEQVHVRLDAHSDHLDIAISATRADDQMHERPPTGNRVLSTPTNPVGVNPDGGGRLRTARLPCADRDTWGLPCELHPT